MELQERAAEKVAVTIESVTRELEDARQKAMGEPKGAAAAVSAVLGKAKVHGLLEDRTKVEGKVEVVLRLRGGAEIPLGPDAEKALR